MSAETSTAPSVKKVENAAAAAPAPEKKPVSKLSATSKEFTFNAKVAEFKPKFAAPVAAPPQYNPAAKEFAPAGFTPPMPGQIINTPQGQMMYNPQIQQYVPVQVVPVPNHQHGGYPNNMYNQGLPPVPGHKAPPRGYQGHHGHQGHQGHQVQYQNQAHKHHGNQPEAPATGSVGSNADLPPTLKLQFGSFPPANVQEGAVPEPVVNESQKEATKGPEKEATKEPEKEKDATKEHEKEAAKETDIAKDTKTEEKKGGVKKDIKADPPANRWARSAGEGGRQHNSWGKEKLTVTTDVVADGQVPRGQSPFKKDGRQTPDNAPSGGWKRGENIPFDSLKSNANHSRYDKAALLALFTKNKTVPDVIKSLYPDLSKLERAPLTTKIPAHGGITSGGNDKQRGTRKKQEEPVGLNPDDAAIFDFSNKDGAFTLQKDRLADDADPAVIEAKAKLILNKLSVTKFDKLSDEFMSTGLALSEDLLIRGAEMIVVKAQMEEHFCFMYANLCNKLIKFWTRGPEDDYSGSRDGVDSDTPIGAIFRLKLLTRCQQEFRVSRAASVEEIKNNADYAEDVKEEKLIILKKRYNGHMRFIGELYLIGLVTPKIMHDCVSELLTLSATEDESLVCMCKLLVTIGVRLETYDIQKGHTSKFASYFERVADIMNKHTDSRMRFMLRDLIDQRASGWVARRAEEKAQDLAEIRKPSGFKATNTRSQSNPSNVASGEWSTVSSGKKANPAKAFDDRSNTKTVTTSQGNAFSALSSNTRFSPNSSSRGKEKMNWSTGRKEETSKGDRRSPSTSSPRENREPTNVGAAASAVADVVTPELRLKVRSILGEYYVNDDDVEALESLKEIINPSLMGEVIGASKGCIDYVFEHHAKDCGKLCKFMLALYNEKFLSIEQIKVAAFAFLDNFDETLIDSPNASRYGAEIMAGLITDKLLSLDLFNDLPEENMFLMSFRRATFLGDLLSKLVTMSSADDVSAKIDAITGGMDVLSMVSAGPKETEEEAQSNFLNKYSTLSFLKKN